MASTVINVDVFEQPYQLALIFSLFEGLKEGESFKVVSAGDLELLKSQFVTAKVQNLKFVETHLDKNITEVEVKKVPGHGHGGCCGMCG